LSIEMGDFVGTQQRHPFRKVGKRGLQFERNTRTPPDVFIKKLTPIT